MMEKQTVTKSVAVALTKQVADVEVFLSQATIAVHCPLYVTRA